MLFLSESPVQIQGKIFGWWILYIFLSNDVHNLYGSYIIFYQMTYKIGTL